MGGSGYGWCMTRAQAMTAGKIHLKTRDFLRRPTFSMDRELHEARHQAGHQLQPTHNSDGLTAPYVALLQRFEWNRGSMSREGALLSRPSSPSLLVALFDLITFSATLGTPFFKVTSYCRSRRNAG